MAQRYSFPTKKYAQVKRFNGKPYKFIDRHDTKRAAQQLQKTIKGKGHLARIIKSRYGYEVWAYYGNIMARGKG